jgi:hypothetical protein
MYVQDQGNISKDMNELRGNASCEQAIEQGVGLLNLGEGDIIVDSAADESCSPAGHGDAYPTKQASRGLKLRTANGGDMQCYGEKRTMFKHTGSQAKDPVGLKFQATDVKKPLLAVRRLVEKGNIVVLPSIGGESYILNKQAKVKIPIVNKGGSFVIEAGFVQGFEAGIDARGGRHAVRPKVLQTVSEKDVWQELANSIENKG